MSDGPEDRGTCCIAIEVIEAKVVPEEVRYTALERVQLSESVFSKRDQNVDSRPLEQTGQLLEHWTAVRVVDEVLLELVEDDVRLGTVDLECLMLGPRRQQSYVGFRSDTSQLADNTGTENRTLANPRFAIQHGQARCEHIRNDHLSLALASEEEQRIEI